MTILKSNNSIDSPIINLCNNKKSSRFSNRNLLKNVFNSSHGCHRYDVEVGDYCNKTSKMILRTTRTTTTSTHNAKLKALKRVHHTNTNNNSKKVVNKSYHNISLGTQINKIKFGPYSIDSWFLSPYPIEYCNKPYLYICEYCFKYMKTISTLKRHEKKCNMRHPPGDEIYRQGNISIFEVDGSKNKIYCQQLCLLTKLFLDHKTLFYDVEPFLFYIVTETDQYGCHFVGYFSKEKESFLDYNVSCILILPVHQRKGYGQYLIDFSYLLTKQEKSIGSPEKPLSKLGTSTYQKYWKYTLFKYLANQSNEQCSIEDISTQTGMIPDDIVSTLERNNMIVLQDGRYILHINEQLIKEELKEMESKQSLKVDSTKLIWKPFQLPELSPSHEDEYDSYEDEECCSITTN